MKAVESDCKLTLTPFSDIYQSPALTNKINEYLAIPRPSYCIASYANM